MSRLPPLERHKIRSLGEENEEEEARGRRISLEVQKAAMKTKRRW
jgi:hypothetical protein